MRGCEHCQKLTTSRRGDRVTEDCPFCRDGSLRERVRSCPECRRDQSAQQERTAVGRPPAGRSDEKQISPSISILSTRLNEGFAVCARRKDEQKLAGVSAWAIGAALFPRARWWLTRPFPARAGDRQALAPLGITLAMAQVAPPLPTSTSCSMPFFMPAAVHPSPQKVANARVSRV